MALYEPLRESMRDFRHWVRERDRFNQEQEALSLERERNHELKMRELDMRDAQVQRANQARRYFSEVASGIMTRNPYQDRQNRIAVIDRELPNLKKQVNSIKNDRRFATQRLTQTQTISALSKERDQLQSELDDNEFMVNEYLSLANDANSAALQMAQFDPEQAKVFQAFSDNARGQANSLTQLMNATARDTAKGKTKMIEVYDRTSGDMTRVIEAKPGHFLRLEKNETTQEPSATDKTETGGLIRFYNKESEYAEIDSQYVSKDPTKNGILAAKRQISKRTGVPVENITTEIPKGFETGTGPSPKGGWTVNQAEDNLVDPFGTRDLETNILEVNPGLENKVQALEQIWRVSQPETDFERPEVVANIHAKVKNLEMVYWEMYDKLQDSRRKISRENYETELNRLNENFKLKIIKLSEKPHENPDLAVEGIWYIPSPATRKNLEGGRTF